MADESRAAPRIARISWGTMNVEGIGEGKDLKLYPGGGRVWDWRETGTQHVPGIQPEDVRELLDAGASVIVLSRGMQARLQVAPQTLELLEGVGVQTYVEDTPEAVDLYNRLVRTEPVGGLFHSTC